MDFNFVSKMKRRPTAARLAKRNFCAAHSLEYINGHDTKGMKNIRGEILKNRKFVVSSLLGVLGLGAIFGGVCLATGQCGQAGSTPITLQAGASANKSETKAEIKELHWHTKLDDAMSESAATGKPIFVDFHATWCPPCKMMEEKTFPSAAFTTEADDWVLLKIDVDKDVETAIKYGATGLPTLGVLKADGKPVAGVSGYHPPGELIEFMHAAKNQLKYG
jgi:thiol:disulfide interchange protein